MDGDDAIQVLSAEVAKGKDCWYCGDPLLEGVPVSVDGLLAAHNECRPTYQEEDESEASERVVVEYETGGKRRRDVYEDGVKRVEELDYVDDNGDEVWELIVTVSADDTDVEIVDDNVRVSTESAPFFDRDYSQTFGIELEWGQWNRLYALASDMIREREADDDWPDDVLERDQEIVDVFVDELNANKPGNGIEDWPDDMRAAFDNTVQDMFMEMREDE